MIYQFDLARKQQSEVAVSELINHLDCHFFTILTALSSSQAVLPIRPLTCNPTLSFLIMLSSRAVNTNLSL